MSNAKKPDITLEIDSDQTGRLDRFLAAQFADWSRTSLQRLINKRFVLVDGHPASPKHNLRKGQKVDVFWPQTEQKPASNSKKKGKVPYPVLFEDKAMLVIDKPAGVVVHPAAGHLDGDTLVEILKPHIESGPWPDEMRPGLVHRLDRDTSGVIVLAKTPEAHGKLSKQFSLRQVKKTYVALVKGSMPVKEGTIESHLARHPGKRQRFAVSSARGRWASTKFAVKEHFGDVATLVELTPLTGRTHQIRVHLASYGHAILGDHVYGENEKEFSYIKRHLLHAAALEITHPTSQKKLRFEAPLPADFQDALKVIRSAA